MHPAPECHREKEKVKFYFFCKGLTCTCAYTHTCIHTLALFLALVQIFLHFNGTAKYSICSLMLKGHFLNWVSDNFLCWQGWSQAEGWERGSGDLCSQRRVAPLRYVKQEIFLAALHLRPACRFCSFASAARLPFLQFYLSGPPANFAVLHLRPACQFCSFALASLLTILQFYLSGPPANVAVLHLRPACQCCRFASAARLSMLQFCIGSPPAKFAVLLIRTACHCYSIASAARLLMMQFCIYGPPANVAGLLLRPACQCCSFASTARLPML